MTVVKTKKSTRDKKMSIIKRKLKFKNYKSCLKATQLENKINHLEKKFCIDSTKRNNKEFVRNNKSILKTQQIFTEEINKIALKLGSHFPK